jgi:hypothetical protein
MFNLANIPDGIANTVFIAERFAQFPGKPGRFTDPDGKTKQANNLWAWPAAYPATPPAACTKPVPQNAALFAYGWPEEKAAGFGLEAFGVPQPGVAANTADYRLAQSAHPKVVYVGMGDGSCHGVSARVTEATWKSALLPADGIPLGADW